MNHRRRNKKRSPPAQLVGLAWFTQEEWQKLTEVVPDRSELDDTYEQWESSATDALAMIKRQGYIVKKVMIEVERLMEWCRQHGKQPVGSARSDYVMHLLQEGRHEI